MDRLSVDPDLAGIRVVEPEEDVHQRRFAGAVFAEQGVNLALATTRSMPSLATTPGNRLTMPRISTAGGALWLIERPSPQAKKARGERRRFVASRLLPAPQRYAGVATGEAAGSASGATGLNAASSSSVVGTTIAPAMIPAL